MRWTLTDVFVSLVMVVLLCVMTLGAKHSADEIKNRKLCESNLRQIGQAMQLYANENRGAHPRTIFDVSKADSPTWGTPYEKAKDLGANKDANPFAPDNSGDLAKYRPAPNDVSAGLFLLMRTEEITSAVFVCPSTQLTAYDFGGGDNTALNWTNFPGNAALRQHLSYSYQNPYPSQAAIDKGFKFNTSIDVRFAMASDMNPGGDALVKISTDSSAEEQAKGNSHDHQGEGQNVLFGDGHVDFQTTPLCGINADNIFTYGDSGTDFAKKGGDGVVGAPVGPNDSILLPTAQDLGENP